MWEPRAWRDRLGPEDIKTATGGLPPAGWEKSLWPWAARMSPARLGMRESRVNEQQEASCTKENEKVM